MSLLNSLLTLPLARRRSEIEIFRQYPIEIQEETLKKLLAAAEKTEWGSRHGYRDIKTAADFQARVPIQTYESLQPFIAKMQAGEKDILWPGEAKWFARSSGTTGARSKYIPVTKESLEDCHYRGGKDLIALYAAACPETGLLTGKTLSLGGTQQKDDSTDTYCGDLSAILMSNLPFWAQLARTPNLDVALLGEWEEKIKRIAADSLDKNIVSLMGVPSWMLVLLYHILKTTGKENISQIWPNLELFIHGGISFSPYREQFQKIIPSPKMKYWEVYNASEGFFAMNECPGADDMLLMLDYGVYYEFLPLEELDRVGKTGPDAPRALTLLEVELGKNYALVISTNGGLWRYLIGDTVMFTSLKPFRIKITGRTKHYINAFGEELMIHNADQALGIACAKTGAALKDYTAAPFFMDENNKGGHEWLIEFSRVPESLVEFGHCLDDALKTLNSDYEAKRYKDITLGPPRLVLARTNLFRDWLESKHKLGGQNKVPRLANNRDYLEELLTLNQPIRQG